MSYRGYTVNIQRRLRQHRKEIKGGAKYTRRFKKRKLLAYIDGFPSKRVAMSYEWCTKRQKLKCHKDMLRTSPLSAIHPKAPKFFAPLKMEKFKGLHHEVKIYLSPSYFNADTAAALQTHYEVEVVLGTCDEPQEKR